MLQELMTAVGQWPVIVQGALGSALFALLSFLGQRAIRALSNFLANNSKTLRKDNLFRELFQKKHVRIPGRQDSINILCLFQAASFSVRGLIFLALGIALENLVPLSLTIGALGLLYYLFRAVLWLDPFVAESKETDLQIWTRVKEIETELFGAAESDTLEKLNRLSASQAQPTVQADAAAPRRLT